MAPPIVDSNSRTYPYVTVMTEVNVAIGDGFNGYSSEDDEHTPKSKRSDVSVTVSNVPQTLFEDASSKVC